MKRRVPLKVAGILALVLVVSNDVFAAHQIDPALEHARRLLHDVILIDGHNDLPRRVLTSPHAAGRVENYDLRGPVTGQTDIARLRQGGLGAQFWSVYIPGEMPDGFVRAQLEQIDLATRIIARYPDTFVLARSAADIRAAHKANRIASLLGIEGGHAIENSMGVLRAYYALGVRYMTLTHNTHTDWADSAALPPVHGGLTSFGEQVVREMNRLGMLVDLSHVATQTMDDALRVSKAPVIFSHSAARALCDVPRNVPDDILRRVTTNGGVVMVAFVPGFINPEVAKVQQPVLAEYNRRAAGLSIDARARLHEEMFVALQLPKTTVARVADHIEYVRKVAGVEHVGLGSDFDGNPDWPEGLSDVSMYPNLFAELIRRGWSDADLERLAGANVLRVLEEAERVALSMRREPDIGGKL